MTGNGLSRSLLIIAALGVLVAMLSQALLLVFAAVLLAALLDATVDGVMKVTRLGRGWSLTITLVLITGAVVAATVLGARSLLNQFDDFLVVLSNDWGALTEYLGEFGIHVPEELDLTALWQNDEAELRSIFGYADSTFGLLSNLIVIVLLAIFLAASPRTYRNGLLTLVPMDYRPRLGEVLDKAGSVLKWWFVGQLLLMVIVTVSISILLLVLGIPHAILLGLIAGILNFIPFLGPILALVPIVTALVGQDWTTALIVLALYTLIQQVEGNVLAPLIHQRIIDLSPGLTIGFLLIMGVLFGGVGVVLATPILAVSRVIVLELYVRDILGDPGAPPPLKGARRASP